MEIKNDNQHYGIVAKILHWSIALLIIAMLAGGFFLDDLPKALKPTIINLHKLIGLTILLLALLFIWWRKINVKPVLPANTPPSQLFLARFVHHLLISLAIIMPLAGWIMSSSAGKGPRLGNWVINFPGVSGQHFLGGFCWNLHATVAWILIVLVGLHFLAALKHALVNKDGILQRMWF